MGSITDKRRVVAAVIITSALAFMFVPSTLPELVSKLATAVLLVIALVLLVAPRVSRPSSIAFALAIWFAGTGLLVASVVHYCLLTVGWILRTFVLRVPYLQEILTTVTFLLLVAIGILIPVVSVIAAEFVLERKWLWGVYLAQISAFLLLLAFESGWAHTVETMMVTGLFGAGAGFVTFITAQHLAGFNLKDYSYLDVTLMKSTHEIAGCFRNRQTFRHQYRPPTVMNESPLMVDIRPIGDIPYSIRVFGQEKETSMTRLEIVAFRRRGVKGILDRSARSDAFCNDILALISNELNCRPATRTSVTSRPTTADRDLESFALRENRAILLIKIMNALTFLGRKRAALAKLIIFVTGVLLIYEGFVDPEQTWLKSIGIALAVISFFMQLWGPITTRLRKERQ
nr:hypothetical protein [Candidatus Njordarchaeum guaymaensis]